MKKRDVRKHNALLAVFSYYVCLNIDSTIFLASDLLFSYTVTLKWTLSWLHAQLNPGAYLVMWRYFYVLSFIFQNLNDSDVWLSTVVRLGYTSGENAVGNCCQDKYVCCESIKWPRKWAWLWVCSIWVRLPRLSSWLDWNLSCPCQSTAPGESASPTTAPDLVENPFSHQPHKLFVRHT